MSRWTRPCSWACSRPERRLADELAGVGHRQRPQASTNWPGQAVDILHHQEPGAVDIAGVVGLDDVRMVELADGLHLALEAGDRLGVDAGCPWPAPSGPPSFELGVPGLVDRAHAAFAQLGQQLVFAQAAQTAVRFIAVDSGAAPSAASLSCSLPAKTASTAGATPGDLPAGNTIVARWASIPPPPPWPSPVEGPPALRFLDVLALRRRRTQLCHERIAPSVDSPTGYFAGRTVVQMGGDGLAGLFRQLAEDESSNCSGSGHEKNSCLAPLRVQQRYNSLPRTTEKRFTSFRRVVIEATREPCAHGRRGCGVNQRGKRIPRKRIRVPWRFTRSDRRARPAPGAAPATWRYVRPRAKGPARRPLGGSLAARPSRAKRHPRSDLRTPRGPIQGPLEKAAQCGAVSPVGRFLLNVRGSRANRRWASVPPAASSRPAMIR